MKVINLSFLIVLIFFGFSAAANDVSINDDRDFIMANYDLWRHDVFFKNPESVAQHIQLSKETLEQYKTGSLPFNSKHSPQASEYLWFLFDETFKVFEIADASSKNLEDFLEVLERGLIIIRTGINETKSIEKLKPNIEASVKEAVNDIANNGSSQGTASELQFVYSFLIEWQGLVSKSENLKSGNEYIKIAEQALDDLIKTSSAPTERSSKTAIFVVTQFLEVMERANRCAKDLKKFLDLFIGNVGLVQSAVEEGLLQDRSLAKTQIKVKEAKKEAIKKIGNCRSLFFF